MEKIVYALWKRDGESREALNQRLRDQAVPKLLELANVKGLRLNLQDETVLPAEPLRQKATDPQMDAVVQMWVNLNHDEYRAPIDAILGNAAGRIAAWLVAESAVIPNNDHLPSAGQRTYGFSQFCFIQKPDWLTYDEWRYNWQGLHTAVGRDTQSNFEYIQNLIVRPLIDGPVSYACCVEECFPPEAMENPAMFFDAVGDPEKFARNSALMMESCARFIDVNDKRGAIDVLLTSQFDVKPPSFR
jgi:hypothetical protein